VSPEHYLHGAAVIIVMCLVAAGLYVLCIVAAEQAKQESLFLQRHATTQQEVECIITLSRRQARRKTQASLCLAFIIAGVVVASALLVFYAFM
jgi:hypothetical protein